MSKLNKMLIDNDKLISAIRSGDYRLAHELMAQSHILLCEKVSSLSDKVSSFATHKDIARAIVLFYSLVIASLGLFISIR